MKNKKTKKGNFWKNISVLILFYLIGQFLYKFIKKVVVKFSTKEDEHIIDAEVEITEDEQEE